MIIDWNSPTYLSSQVFITFAYALLAASYFITSRRKLLATTISSNLSMGVGFALLGGWVGVCMCIIAISRDITSTILSKQRKPEEQMKITRLDLWLLGLWVSLFTIATLFTANSFFEMFAYFATLTFTVSIWQKNGFIYRFLGIFVGIFWIIYNIVLKNFMGFTLESALLIFVIIGFITYIKNQRKLKL